MDSIGSKPAEPAQAVSKKLCLACNRQYEDAGLSHCPVDSTQLVNLGRDETKALIGKTINSKYKVIEVVGKGGMGTVFKAEQLGLGRHVAIKMLKAQLSEDKVSVKRFEQEATASASLQHPNLITLFDHGMIDEKQPYLVMEFLEGESLNSIIREHGCVNPVRCLRIFSQVMEGLTAAHAKGVVHRDIKPSNIILIKNEKALDVVKVVDFGLAKLMPWSGKESQHLTKTGEVFGSPIYMSPEQCQGKQLKETSDVYSVAVTLYEALTGKPPFKGRNVVETASMHISSQPPAFEIVRPDLRLSNKLQSVIFKALDKNPQNRYPNMEEFRKALTEAISGPGSNDGFRGENEAAELPTDTTQPVRVDNRPPSSLSKQRQMEQKSEDNRRKVTMVAALVCVGLVLACGGVFLLNMNNQKSAEAKVNGIVWFLELERQKNHRYGIKEVHIMPTDGTSRTDLVRLEGSSLTGKIKLPSDHLRIGDRWVCKVQDKTSIAELSFGSDSQGGFYEAFKSIVKFAIAVGDKDWDKAAGFMSTHTTPDSVKEKWSKYAPVQTFKIDDTTGGIEGIPASDPYATTPLPQCVKVAAYDESSQSIELLVDTQAIFLRNGKRIESNAIQKVHLTYQRDELSWKIKGFEPTDQAEWEKY